jgi:diguanylate cyclase (GGDEF)-like protein
MPIRVLVIGGELAAERVAAAAQWSAESKRHILVRLPAELGSRERIDVLVVDEQAVADGLATPAASNVKASATRDALVVLLGAADAVSESLRSSAAPSAKRFASYSAKNIACEARVPPDGSPRELAQTIGLVASLAQVRRRDRQRRRNAERFRRLSMLDPLTGIANRRAWDVRTAQVCRQRRRRAGNDAPGDVIPDTSIAPVCVAVFDLDHFKAINDTRGHSAGDAVLIQIARQLVEHVRDHDFVARLGGDEFAVVFVNLDVRSAAVVVERIRQRVAAAVRAGLSKAWGEEIGGVTLSAGWAAMVSGDSARGLFDRADAELAAAKAAGRNQTRPTPIDEGAGI